MERALEWNRRRCKKNCQFYGLGFVWIDFRIMYVTAKTLDWLAEHRLITIE
jgi:hypothetical protein